MYIKTISIRVDKDLQNKLEELQATYEKTYGIPIDQSNLIRKMINDVHKGTVQRRSGMSIQDYRSLSN